MPVHDQQVEQIPPITQTTVVETQPEPELVQQQQPLTFAQQPAPVRQYTAAQPTVVRQAYNPAPVATVFNQSSYRPKKVFRFANPDYSWNGPVVGAETQGHTQLVRQAYGGSQMLGTNTVRTQAPIIRTSQSSRVVTGGTYTTSQPTVIRKSYNTSNVTYGATTKTVAPRQVIRYRQEADGTLTQISGPTQPYPSHLQADATPQGSFQQSQPADAQE